MTFDDGMLALYASVNTAPPGDRPVYAHVKKGDYYFAFETLGYQRFYAALKADQRIEHVADIPGWVSVDTSDTVVMEDGIRYRVQLAQPSYDRDGLKITRLTLERTGDTDA